MTTDSGGWIYQGRQAHGWSGTGTGTKPEADSEPPERDAADAGLFAPRNLGQRIDYAAQAAIGGSRLGICMMSNHMIDDDGAHVLLSFVGDNLDPAPLIALIPLTSRRPKRKGDLMGRPRDGRPPALAKTAVCSFTTGDRLFSGDPNDHVRFLLGIIQERIEVIREIVRQQSLRWTAWLFEGNSEGQKFSDLDPALARWAAELGSPLLRKEPDRVILVYDVPKPGQ